MEDIEAIAMHAALEALRLVLMEAQLDAGDADGIELVNVASKLLQESLPTMPSEAVRRALE